jgi:hypothetical protein
MRYACQNLRHYILYFKEEETVDNDNMKWRDPLDNDYFHIYLFL